MKTVKELEAELQRAKQAEARKREEEREAAAKAARNERRAANHGVAESLVAAIRQGLTEDKEGQALEALDVNLEIGHNDNFFIRSPFDGVFIELEISSDATRGSGYIWRLTGKTRVQISGQDVETKTYRPKGWNAKRIKTAARYFAENVIAEKKKNELAQDMKRRRAEAKAEVEAIAGKADVNPEFCNYDGPQGAETGDRILDWRLKAERYGTGYTLIVSVDFDTEKDGDGDRLLETLNRLNSLVTPVNEG